MQNVKRVRTVLGNFRRLVSTGLVICAVALLVTAALTRSAAAQVDTGSIQGAITDSSGAAVVGAIVVLRNEGTGFTETFKSGQSGEYNFRALRVGSYSVTVTIPGFEKLSKAHLQVDVQQNLLANLTLKVGSADTTVVVNAGGDVLQTQDASVGQVVEAKEITDLPLNGRNFTMLAQLTAGVTTTQNDSRGLILSGSFVSHGVPSIYNDYLLDGIDNNNGEVDFLDGAAYVVRPPVDAIQQFKVQTSNFSAEFGRSAGAVLNAVTKSGTNRFYGNVWEYTRNQMFDATDYFVKKAGEHKGDFTRNQFGFTLGGPLDIPHFYNGPNKTFFFIDYEATRIHQAVPFTTSVPTALERSSGYTNYQDLISYQSGTQTDALGRKYPLGQIFDPATTRSTTKGAVDPTTGLPANSNNTTRDPFTNNIVPANRIDPVAVKLLNLYPAPTAPGIVNNYSSQPIKTDNDGEYDGRIDQNFGSSDQAFARVSYNSNPVHFPSPLPGLAVGTASFNVGAQTSKASNVALSETHTFSSTTLNEARLGYKHIRTKRTQPFYSDTTDTNAQYGVAGIPYRQPIGGGLTEFNIRGLALLGAHNSLPSDEIAAQFQIMDNVLKQIGNHELHIGFEYDRLKVAVIQPTFAKGLFVYSGTYINVPNGNAASTGGIAQFAILPGPSTVVGGVPNEGGANQVEASDISQEDYRRPTYAAYVQDNWRVTQKLTANLGVRWEDFQMPADHHGFMANFIPGTPNSTAQFLVDSRSQSVPLSPSFLANLNSDGISLVYSKNHALATVTPYNFSPRIGLTYQVMPRLVARAAYGMFYDGVYNNGDGNNLGNNYPFEYTLNYTPPSGSATITPDNSIGLTSNGLKNVPLSPTSVNASGIGLVAMQYNWKIPYVQSSNFTLQYEISNNQSLTATFLTTGGRHLNVSVTANQPTVLLPPSASATPYVAFPHFAIGSPDVRPIGNSNYYGTEVTYQHRLSQGLTVLANYTWSQSRTDASDTLFSNSVAYRAPLVPGFGIHGDYGFASSDVRNATHIATTYELPFGRGKAFLSGGRVLNAFVGGWRMSGIFTLQSGIPVTVTCSVTTGARSGCVALKVPGVGLYTGAHTVAHWANAAAFANPPAVTAVGQTDFTPLGGSTQQLVSPGFHRGDVSIGKRWATSDRTALEFRGDFFNVTNTPNFAPPGNLNFGSALTFASITATRDSPNDPREIQLGVDFYFGVH